MLVCTADWPFQPGPAEAPPQAVVHVSRSTARGALCCYSLVSAQVHFLYIRWVPFIDPCEPDMALNAVKTISATR